MFKPSATVGFFFFFGLLQASLPAEAGPRPTSTPSFVWPAGVFVLFRMQPSPRSTLLLWFLHPTLHPGAAAVKYPVLSQLEDPPQQTVFHTFATTIQIVDG